MAYDTDEFCEALDAAGLDWEPYSGRGMMGAKCVSLRLDSERELWQVANELGLQDVEIAPPRVDNMGLRLVAYWPAHEVPA